MKQFWVLNEGSAQADGPFDENQLGDGIRDGRWAPNALACEVGKDEWVAISEVRGCPQPNQSPRTVQQNAESPEWTTAINVRLISAHPIVKLLNLMIAVLEFLTGTRRSGTLTIGASDIVVETTVRVFWMFPKSHGVLRIGRSRVTGVEVATSKALFFFQSNVCSVFASGVTVPMHYEVKCSYGELQHRMAKLMY